MSLAPQAAVSWIERVTVFRMGAEVRRVAELEPPRTYPAVIVLPGLPLQLRDESVQLSIEAMADGNLASCPQAVDVQLALQPPPPDPSLPPATDRELRDAQAELRIQQRAAERLEGHIECLDELSSPARPDPAEGEATPPPPTQARLDLLAFQCSELERLHQELDGAREAARLARVALELIQTRRDTHRQQRQLKPHELRKEARITLQAPAGGDSPAPRFRLVLSYLVPAARWAPAYSLHIDPAAGSARLAMRAQVCQHSDEDWSGVQLVLSTADALRWAELPELHALRIGRAQPPSPSTGWRPPPAGVERLFEDWARAQALIPRGAGGQGAPPEPAPPTQPVSRAERLVEPEPEYEEVKAMDLDLAVEQSRAPAPRRRAKRSARPPAPKAIGGMQFLASAMSPAAAQSAPEPQSDELTADAPIAGNYGGPPPPPPALEAGRDLLDYDSLRMAGPDSHRRGRLEPIDGHQRYRELLGPTQRAAVPSGSALRAHVQIASRKVRSQALSAGLVAPASIDAYDHAWRGERPVDVPCDGRFHTVPVLTSSAEISIGYVAVPRETQEVFRTVSLVNPLAAPLLAGPVDVYMNGDYLLAASVTAVPAGGDLLLGLGVEEAIRVSRNTRFSEKQRGMMSRHQDLVHEIHIELRNLLAQPASIEVRERIPVHRKDDEEIDIELREVEPPWTAWKQKQAPLRGAYRWHLEIEPGQVRQLRASYVITISPKHQLSGGNRREG